MGLSGKATIVGLVLLVAIAGVADAQVVCKLTIPELLECRPAATPPNPPPPSAACCSALGHADFGCLCGYRTSPILPGLNIDPDLALQLPEKCKIPNAPKC